MARMPGAVWRPYPVGARALRRKGRGVAYHVAVSEAESLRPFPGADWHFYVSKKGVIYQFVDTDYQAWTTGAGNSSMIGVETQGGVRNVNGEKWSDAQVTALAKIARWAHETEGIPLRLMRNSLPTERGLGWHKLGVDPWRVAGGEKWSSAYGKECPGLAKIAQMPEVLRRAQQGEDDMPDAQEVAAAVWNYDAGGEEGKQEAKHLLSQARTAARANAGQLAGLTVAVGRMADALATQQGLDAAELKKAVRDGVNEGIQDAGAAVRAVEKSSPA